MQKPLIDLRADRRYAVHVSGILQVEGNVYVVEVLDVSSAGLRITCPISIPVGARLVVTTCHTDIVGEVQEARAVGANEFRLSVEALTAAVGGLDLTPFLEPIARYL